MHNTETQYHKVNTPVCCSTSRNSSSRLAIKLRKSLLMITICGLITTSNAALALWQPAHPAAASANHPEAAAANPLTSNSSLTAATVRKIDVAQAKITLKHAAIANIGMPAMTMVFKVADPSLLTGLTVNDEVLFSVEKQGSALIVTQIKPQKPVSVE
jgi:Cu/Ag efflux protein CusF